MTALHSYTNARALVNQPTDAIDDYFDNVLTLDRANKRQEDPLNQRRHRDTIIEERPQQLLNELSALNETSI